jgi:hypothetical protein
MLSLVIGSLTIPVSAAQTTTDWQNRLQELDKQIDDLSDLKRKHEAAAVRADDEGMRWQFQQNQKQEAKRAYQRADNHREIARKIQLQIDALKKEREQILLKHPDAYAPSP